MYVQRDESGVITGAYRNPQPGYAEETVEDDAPELLAFLVPPSPTAVQLAAQRRQEAISQLLTSLDPRDIALRALVRDLYTVINDLRELHGLPRQLESTIIPRVVAGIGEGLGEV